MDVGVHTFRIMHEACGERFPVPILFEKLLQAGAPRREIGKGDLCRRFAQEIRCSRIFVQ